MSKIIDIDAIANIAASLTVRIGGKDYTLHAIDRGVSERLSAVFRDIDDDTNLHDALSRQLGAILNVEPAEFAGLDVRLIKAAVSSLMEEINRAGESGNRPARRAK